MKLSEDKWSWTRIVLKTTDNKSLLVPTHLFDTWKGRLTNFRSELIDPCNHAYQIVHQEKDKIIVKPYTISFHSWNIGYFEPVEKTVEIKK